MPRSMIAASLLLLGCLAHTARASDDAPAPAPIAPAPAAPPVVAPAPAAPEAEPAIDPVKSAAVLKIVDELRIEAAKIRGLAWKKEVPAELISRAQLKRNLEQMIKDELKPDEYERDVKLLHRLGLLRPDQDPLEIEKAFLEKGIAGYFNPKTKRFYVVDGLTGEGQRPTILHELVHALEDQYIDLDVTLKRVEKDGDRVFALKCVIEGSAEHARLAFESEHPGIAKIALEDQKKSSGADMAKIVATTPALLLLPTLLQYQTGPAFVGRAGGKDYVGGMARLYEDPPTTEEQVMHPGKFLGAARDLPRKITWPTDLAATLGEGWKAFEETPVGELDVALWLDRWFGAADGKLDMGLMASGRFYTKEAQTAAEGWDGMTTQLLEVNGKPTTIVMISAWDSPKDAQEAADAFAKALSKQYGKEFALTGFGGGDAATRSLAFSGPFGEGRLEVRGDEVRLLDGVPADALGRVWAKISAAKIERDPADTWSAETEVDPIATAAWKDVKFGAGWNKPSDDWTLEDKGAEGGTVVSKGTTSLRIDTRAGGLQENLLKLFVEFKKRHPTAKLDMQAIQEAAIGTKEAAKFVMPDGATTRHIYVAPIGDALLIADCAFPTSESESGEKAVAAALGGFLFK